MTALGAVLGFAVACVAVAAIAGHNGLGGSAVLGHSLLDGNGIALMVAAWAVSLGVLLAAERMPAGDARIGPFSPIDLLAAAALAAAVLAAARGSADSGDLRSSDPLLPLLPRCVCLAAGWWRRGQPAAWRGWQNGPRRSRSPGPRLAALWLARGGAHSSITTGFLVVSIGLALFAGTYAGTLERGERDQAAFQVPASVTIGEGAQLVSPLGAAPLVPVHAAGPGGLGGAGAAPHRHGAADRPQPGAGGRAGRAGRGRASAGAVAVAVRHAAVARPAPLAGISLPASSTRLSRHRRLRAACR